MRKELNLTQQEFADRIGISRGNIATYETRDGSPGSSVIALICREFHVSEAWLRTGEGEMFLQQTKEDEIKAIVEQILTGEPPEFRRRLIVALSTLKEEHWLLLEEKIQEIAGVPGAGSGGAVTPLGAAARDGSRPEAQLEDSFTLPDSVLVIPQKNTAEIDGKGGVPAEK